MQAKVKRTQQVINVTCTDIQENPNLNTWQSDDGELFLGNELSFDLTDYKSWVENLIHDIAIERYKKGVPEDNRKAYASDVVLFAYAVLDRMMQEAKTWGL